MTNSYKYIVFFFGNFFFFFDTRRVPNCAVPVHHNKPVHEVHLLSTAYMLQKFWYFILTLDERGCFFNFFLWPFELGSSRITAPLYPLLAAVLDVVTRKRKTLGVISYRVTCTTCSGEALTTIKHDEIILSRKVQRNVNISKYNQTLQFLI